LLNQKAGVFDGVQTDRLAVRNYKLWHAAYLIWIECLHILQHMNGKLKYSSYFVPRFFSFLLAWYFVC